jgi:predicted RNA-binding Zn ribbon-like protein
VARSPKRAPAADDDIARVMAFVNTLSSRGSSTPKEALVSYAALVEWARGAGIVSGGVAAELRRHAEAHAREADRVVANARELRETLHALFSAVAEDKAPAPSLLAALAGHLGAGYARARLVFQDGTLQWAPGPVAALEDICREVARAAARLVGSGSLAHVRACAAEDCRWWFVDDTRNHSRRWCEMKTCGNRAKLRRFRARQ